MISTQSQGKKEIISDIAPNSEVQNVSILAFLLLLILPFLGNSQNDFKTLKTVSEKVKKNFDAGVQFMGGKHFEQASKYFSKALGQEPQFIDAQIFLAGAQAQLGNLVNAENGFEKALELSKTYDIEVFFDLGLVEYRQKKYEEAALHFQNYINLKPKKSRRLASAQKYLGIATIMSESTRNDFQFLPKNLGPNINTKGDEYLPALTADGKTLIYSKLIGGRRYGHEDFYQSFLEDGVWQKGEPIEDLNTDYDEAAHTISQDGNLMVYTACNRKSGLGSCDLYIAEQKCGQWTSPNLLPQPVSTGAWESQPAISPDGKTLYFSSSRPGGVGKKDIWFTTRKPDGGWEMPINMGNVINTPGDEKAPFIHPDGQTLYFLSSGHQGLGFEDIFISRRQEDGAWSKPKNMGFPINTESSEGPIFVSLEGETAFFSSSHEKYEGAQGKMDIYSFVLPEHLRPHPVTYVKAIVKDANNSEPLNAFVEFIDLATGNIHAFSNTDCNGAFLVTLPVGKKYALNVSKEKYLFHSEHFALNEPGSFLKPYHLDIKLISIPTLASKPSKELPLEKSTPIILKNVFFETASAALKEESLSELNRLKKLLNDNPELKIQINGHTDNVGSEEDNLTLSNNRAKAVYDFLIQNAIDAERLTYKGFGETMPIDSNETEEGRRQNRRTEFEVIIQEIKSP